MTKILSLSGRKQAGKNTSANWLLGVAMSSLGIIRDRFDITEKGQLRVSDIFGDDSFYGVFDYYNNNPVMKEFLEENIHPYFKLYSFADLLKRDVCINLLGLSEEQCFGTDAQKKSLTHLCWEDMPGVVTEGTEEELEVLKGRLGDYYGIDKAGLIYHAPGLMTAREVMQFVGTNIFRRMYGDIWAKGTIKRILAEGSGLAVITDCRFPNEISATQEANGKVIRLTRTFDEDNHDSETALDKENFDWSKFDIIVDNKDMSITQQNDALYNELKGFEYFN